MFVVSAYSYAFLMLSLLGPPWICEREEGVDWRFAGGPYQHWDKQEAEGAHVPGLSLRQKPYVALIHKALLVTSWPCREQTMRKK